MIWKNRELKTYGEIGSAFIECKSKEEAVELFNLYKKECEFAGSNIGYLLGYYNDVDAKRIYEWLDEAIHPIFGQGFGRGKEVSDEEAFQKGLELEKNRGESND